MKRKVIQLALNTLVVSLPSKWVKRYGVKKGAELEVEERGQQIVFGTSMNSDLESVRIDASKLSSEALKRWVLSSLHKTGYNQIEITYEDNSVSEIVQEAIRNLMIGFAVVEQGRGRCVIRVVAEEQEKEFHSMLRRAFIVTKTLGDEIYLSLVQGNGEHLKELLVLEKTNNQLTNFCERILNRKGYKQDKKRCFAYVVAWNLEKICDDYAYLCKVLMESPKAKISAPVLDMLKEANDYFKDYYELFYNFEIEKLSGLQRRKNRFKEKTFRLVKNKNQTEIVVLCKLEDLVTRTSDFSASFLTLNMD